MPEQTEFERVWAMMLAGEAPTLNRFRAIFGRIPSSPRCKLCLAPFGFPGRTLVRLVGAGPSPLNRRLCKLCIRSLHKAPGGAEVELTAVFADVRGSTGLAERMSPVEYSRLIARFYGLAAAVVDEHDGLVDKFVGDEVVALFVPGFAGPDHAGRAIAAAEELVQRARDEEDCRLELGVGVHTGISFVGTVGEGDAVDFTALGDAVNVAARLRSLAGPREVVISDETARAAGLDTSGWERRTVELRGREQALDAWVMPVGVAAAAAA